MKKSEPTSLQKIFFQNFQLLKHPRIHQLKTSKPKHPKIVKTEKKKLMRSKHKADAWNQNKNLDRFCCKPRTSFCKNEKNKMDAKTKLQGTRISYLTWVLNLAHHTCTSMTPKVAVSNNHISAQACKRWPEKVALKWPQSANDLEGIEN